MMMCIYDENYRYITHTPKVLQHNNKQTMSSIPPYDISIDELRVGLSFANELVTFHPVQIGTPKTVVAKPGGQAKDNGGGGGDEDEDDEDFDVFGDADDADADDAVGDKQPKESREEMLARLEQEAQDRAAKKEAKQRTLVAIEIKPWEVEQDLMALWKKITETITQPGLKWGESCTLVPVAFGIKKIQCTFVMGVENSSDEVVDAILELEDEVQSCEIVSMNVL